MGEIVNIQVGGCGNLAGARFWETICEEHSIDTGGTYIGDYDPELEKIKVYFNEMSGWRYIPRSVMIDLEPDVINSVRAGPFSKIFRQNSTVSGTCDANNNWARGYFAEGELRNSAVDLIRKEVEACDSLQGFQFVHSLGGGTGSGLGALVIDRLKEEYPDKVMHTFSLFPSNKVSDVIVEPYNAILSLSKLISQVQGVHVLDNEAFYNICTKKYNLKSPLYSDLNHWVAATMSSVTCCLRYADSSNLTLRKLVTNLVPFPRLHFFMIGNAPFTCRGFVGLKGFTVSELSRQAFLPDNMMCDSNPDKGKYLCSVVVYRGRIPLKEIDEWFEMPGNKLYSYCTQWIPDNIKKLFCPISPRGLKRAVTSINNSTAIKETFKRIKDQFDILIKRKTFLHWYSDEGMDEAELIEAGSRIDDLLYEYQQYQDASVENQERDGKTKLL